MKQLVFLFLILFIYESHCVAQENNANESSSGISAECTFTPKYIWRGITNTDGLAIQPTVTFTQDKFSVQFWSSWSAVENTESHVNEVDIYLSYPLAYGNLTITPAFFYYSYPGIDVNSTGEINVGFSYSLGRFAIETAFSRDVIDAQGSLTNYTDVKFSSEINDKLSFDLSAGVCFSNYIFNRYYLGLEKSATNYSLVNGSISYSLTDNLYLKAFFENYYTLDPEVEELTQKNNFNYGLTVGMEL